MPDVLIVENNARLTAVQYKALTRYLPAVMMETAAKFRRWEDAQAYLFGKFILIKGLKKYNIESTILEKIMYTKYNRPYLPIAIDFNISHSGNYVLCAISTHGKVGIDIERIHPVDINDFKDHFTEKEICSINEAKDKYAEFFRMWTIKEAVIKADGQGLSMPLKEIIIDHHARVNEKNWYVYEIGIASGYVAHMVGDSLDNDEICLSRVSIPLDSDHEELSAL